MNLVVFRGKFLLLTFYLLVGLLFSCTSKLDNSATITFKKGDNSETCEVILKLSDGRSKIIDTFSPRVDGWPEEGRRILYSNISENKNLNFLYVDTLSPTGYGKCIGVYASINTIYAWEGAEFAHGNYYKYFLFESNNKIKVLKEQWSDLDENSGGIDDRGIFNSKSTPIKGKAKKIGESVLIFDSDVSSLSTETTSDSKTFEFGGDFSEMYFSNDSTGESMGIDEYLFSFKKDRIEITLVGVDEEPKKAEIVDNHITYNNNYYYKIDKNELYVYYYDDVRKAYLGEGTPIFQGKLVWSKSKLKNGVVVNKNSVGNNSNEPNSGNTNTNNNNSNIVDKYKSINDFGFEKYTNISTSKLNTKSVLKVNSNSFTKQYKTRVTEFYNDAEINFSGKYTVIYWDAGMGTTLGTLIDCSNGIAYDIPINEETAFIGCFDENKLKIFESIFGSQKVFFTKESNLLVLRSCDEYNNDGIIFRFYIWNEDIKKFSLLKIEKNVF